MIIISLPRSVHHEGGEGEVGGREAVHVHPTAVKSSLPFMGRSYRLEREARRREKEERKSEKEERKTRRKSAGAAPAETTPARKTEEPPGGTPAEGLAARLGQRLVVSLPPEQRPGPQSAPLTIDSRQVLVIFILTLIFSLFRRISSDEARQAVSSWLSTVSPQPGDEVPPTPRLTERKVEKEEGKRKRSKSMSKAKEEKEGNKGERGGKGKRKGEEGEQANEQVEEDKKGVTIAKLGPFKMSMELKGAGGKAEKGEGERQSKAVRSRSKSRPRDEKTRRQSSKLEEEKEEKIVKEEVTEVEKESKRVESRRKKEKIVVSKMARSDRPLREKSPEKGRRREEDLDERRQKEKSVEDEEDYRLSLNRKREKFTRSVSQPGPPPSLDFLLPAVTNRSSTGKGGLKSKLGSNGSQKLTSGAKNDSFSESQPGPGLRRSNTLQEEVLHVNHINKAFIFALTSQS